LDFKIGNMQDDHEIFKEAQADASLILAEKALQNDYIIDFLKKIAEKLKDINFS